MNFMKLEEFRAHYDGDCLADHEMDVASLGPALLAFGDLARIAYREVDPLSGKVPTVKVQQFRPGSFEILMGIDLSILEDAVNLFSGKQTNAAANALAIGTPLVGLIGWTLRALLKNSKNQLPSKDELVTQLGDELLAEHVHKLQQNRAFREGAKKIVKPLTKDGIDELSLLRRNGEEIVSIDEHEATHILNLESDEGPTVRYEDCEVTIGTPQIEKPLKLKWRLVHPDYGSITAFLRDEEFANSVLRGKVAFSRGARFQAKLRIEEITETSGKIDSRSFEIVQIQQSSKPDPPLE